MSVSMKRNIIFAFEEFFQSLAQNIKRAQIFYNHRVVGKLLNNIG